MRESRKRRTNLHGFDGFTVNEPFHTSRRLGKSSKEQQDISKGSVIFVNQRDFIESLKNVLKYLIKSFAVDHTFVLELKFVTHLHLISTWYV